MNFKWSRSDSSRVLILSIALLLCIVLLFTNDYVQMSGNFSDVRLGLLGMQTKHGYLTFDEAISEGGRYDDIRGSLEHLREAGLIGFLLIVVQLIVSAAAVFQTSYSNYIAQKIMETTATVGFMLQTHKDRAKVLSRLQFVYVLQPFPVLAGEIIWPIVGKLDQLDVELRSGLLLMILASFLCLFATAIFCFTYYTNRRSNLKELSIIEHSERENRREIDATLEISQLD